MPKGGAYYRYKLPHNLEMTMYKKEQLEIVERPGVKWVMQKDMQPPKDCNDLDSFYEDNHVGQIFEGEARSFWSAAKCEINKTSDLIEVVIGLAHAEELA